MRAIFWVAEHLPVYALNLVLTTPTELWALRYPETRGLFVLDRPAVGARRRHLDHSSAAGTIRVRSGDLADAPAVVVASEPMDEDPAWRELSPGELIHVDAQLHLSTRTVIDHPPRHPLSLADPDPAAARSQRSHGEAS